MDEHRHHVIDVYRRVTAVIWQRLSPTFGIRTINAIAKNSIARVKRDHPAIASLRVSESGIEWNDFEQESADAGEEDVCGALDSFLDEFFEALSILIGRLVVGKIVKEAESMMDNGGEE